MNIKDRAMLVAEKAHQNQTYGIYPYMYHIREIADLVESITQKFESHIWNADVLIVTAILHDVLEDSDLSYNDIKKEFGENIAELVYCITDELGRNRKERKSKTYSKIRKNCETVLIKICDRIVNIEYSKRTNSKMFKLYKSEHEIFCDELDIKNWSKCECCVEDAFKKLERVLEE